MAARTDQCDDPRARVIAAACAMLERGLVAGSSGNVSLHVGDVMHITPAGVPYRNLCVDDVVTLGLEGDVKLGNGTPSSEWRAHLAIYRARPDVRAVVHAHPIHATAWSCLGVALDTATEDQRRVLGGPVVVASGPPVHPLPAASVVDALGARAAALLPRHGTVAVGADEHEALAVTEVLEREAQIALLLSASMPGSALVGHRSARRRTVA